MGWPKGVARPQITREKMKGERPQTSVTMKGNSNARRMGYAPVGMTRHPLFLIYYSMICRCTNPKAQRYGDYGGRGISVCLSWLEKEGQGFLNFLEDMGERPMYLTNSGTYRGYTLERRNNDGNYEKGNCYWATYKQQNSNRRD